MRSAAIRDVNFNLGEKMTTTTTTMAATAEAVVKREEEEGKTSGGDGAGASYVKRACVRECVRARARRHSRP